MNVDQLIGTFPRLWHMAADGSWPAIKDRGLFSTSALLDLYGVAGADRFALESRHRPESVTIYKPGLPDAIIRDQKPMSDGALQKCLRDGLTPKDWYETLNSRCFFWLSRARLRRLLAARAYRANPQTVITLRTESLVGAHGPRASLSPLNSGSTIFKPQPRGKDTFKRIADYDFEYWRARRGNVENAVAELVIDYSVADLGDHVLAVHRVHGGQTEELWRAAGTSVDDGP